MGRADSDGFVFIEDRLKDMIITGGENVYSPEIERVLVEHPAIAEVAVIGVPDDRWGETVKAVVVLTAEAQIDEAETDHLYTGTPRKVQVPDQYRPSSRFFPAIPPERSSNATSANRTGRTANTNWSEFACCNGAVTSRRPTTPNPTDPCPCGSGNALAECCGKYISGVAHAPTAETLMRSRYTAFAVMDDGISHADLASPTIAQPNSISTPT